MIPFGAMNRTTSPQLSITSTDIIKQTAVGGIVDAQVWKKRSMLVSIALPCRAAHHCIDRLQVFVWSLVLNIKLALRSQTNSPEEPPSALNLRRTALLGRTHAWPTWLWSSEDHFLPLAMMPSG